MITSRLRRNSPERVFESLYRRHVRDVYQYCRAMLDRQADAEDATQTAFMNVYRALERGERPRDPGPWLRAVALNVCREHHRRAGRRPEEVSLDDDPGELVLEPAAPEIADLIRGLSRLPFNQRAALVMREFEGRSVAEIARALEVSASAVEALLFRARRSLREQLEEKLTCGDAERAISRQLDGALARSERGRLRAHLRECADCAALARRLRAQRSAIRSLALLPLPASLKIGRLAAGGAASAASTAPVTVPAGSALLGAVPAKLAAMAVAGAAAIGVGYVALPGPARHAASPRREPLASAQGTAQAGPVRSRTTRPRHAVVAAGRPGSARAQAAHRGERPVRVNARRVGPARHGPMHRVNAARWGHGGHPDHPDRAEHGQSAGRWRPAGYASTAAAAGGAGDGRGWRAGAPGPGAPDQRLPVGDHGAGGPPWAHNRDPGRGDPGCGCGTAQTPGRAGGGGPEGWSAGGGRPAWSQGGAMGERGRGGAVRGPLKD